MPVSEVDGYRVGQNGWIDVFDSAGKRRCWVEGEIMRLISIAEGSVWVIIKTRMGVGVYRVW